MNLLSTGFLSSSTTDVWARASFAVGGLSRALQMFNSTPGLHPLDVSRKPPPSRDNQNCLQIQPA